jgi:hypothetical protein
VSFFRRRSKTPAQTEQIFVELAPGDQFVRQVGRPGERFWTGLPALSWDAYEQTLHLGDRQLAIEGAMCLLVPTSERMLVMNRATGRILQIELPNLLSVDVYQDKTLGPSRDESFLAFRFQEHGEPATMRFTAKTEQAQVFRQHMTALKTSHSRTSPS